MGTFTFRMDVVIFCMRRFIILRAARDLSEFVIS